MEFRLKGVLASFDLPGLRPSPQVAELCFVRGPLYQEAAGSTAQGQRQGNTSVPCL